MSDNKTTATMADAARRPTVRRELLTALGLVFAGALVVGATAMVLLIARADTPNRATLILSVLFLADVAVFVLFGRHLIQSRVLNPLEDMIAGAQAIARGDVEHRLPDAETAELTRLAGAVNHMAERLLTHQEQMTQNIRSLDETNRMLTEARDELIRTEKLASVGRLASGIAHEVGNPLGAILGYLALIGKNAQPPQSDYVQAAEREARRIDRIVHGLLDYARPREMASRALDVNDVVTQTIELLTMQGRFHELRTELELAEGLPDVIGEPYQLQQVLVNLILNAGDAMAEKPDARVTIGTRSGIYEAPERFSARRKEDPPQLDYTHRRRFHDTPRIPRQDAFKAGAPIVEIIVADNGPGIPQELLGSIFDPFVTSKEPGKGTGLGLAVAARLIDAMGGTIAAESPPGQGATFIITLPTSASLAERDGSA